MTKVVEIEQGNSLEYEIMHKPGSGRYRVRFRSVGSFWPFNRWRWLLVYSIHGQRSPLETTSLQEAETYSDKDIAIQKREATEDRIARAKWEPVPNPDPLARELDASFGRKR